MTLSCPVTLNYYSQNGINHKFSISYFLCSAVEKEKISQSFPKRLQYGPTHENAADNLDGSHRRFTSRRAPRTSVRRAKKSLSDVKIVYAPAD